MRTSESETSKGHGEGERRGVYDIFLSNVSSRLVLRRGQSFLKTHDYVRSDKPTHGIGLEQRQRRHGV